MAKTASRLKALREAAGLSQRELARHIGQDQSNVRYWEQSGKPAAFRRAAADGQGAWGGCPQRRLAVEPQPHRANVLPKCRSKQATQPHCPQQTIANLVWTLLVSFNRNV